ncbi:glycerophosphodiester phosphodiesterase [Candidatus Saccharibacteria bacterium]|nr:glycerophosphodiester phosphodiesterase [Candidatus Saccharibacteria bacterium]
MKNSRLVVIGHRGAMGLAPENTLKSIQKALEHHVDMIEIDVFVARDGSILLNHDAHYTNSKGKKIRIHDSTYDDMKRHHADVTSLQEAIEFIDRTVPLIIELKPGVDADQVCHVVKQYYDRGWTEKDLRFCSYSPSILRRIRQHFPESIIILNHDWSSIRATWLAHRLGTKHIAMYNIWLWPPVIRGISRRGYVLYAYTVNKPTVAKRWHKAGLAGIYTDYPDLFERQS